MKKYLIIALTITSLYSCNKANETKEGHHHDMEVPLNDQTQAMLAIHDSIMPHMDKLMDLKKQLKNDMKSTDSLLALKSTEALKLRKEEALKLTSQLDSTDKAMMNWMHEFKFDTLEKLDKTQAASYVADQKKKIECVREKMNKSLSDANQFIGKTKIK
ncbi:viral A-type inclusion protein [Dyadobacter sp. 3J3]|uniref:viral A-type inclusion protein n=1 Tax=Dyadobacter sp. 3J3 TaxID=2606600 RepID=UPI001358A38B|nr:viral A-type inclusion protein [Dyadobacter sp. 3J3]